MVNENASLVKYEPPKCDECGRKIVVLSDLCAKCAAGIELNGKKQANRPGTNPLPTWPKPPAPPNPPPAQPVQTNQDPCQNCQPGTICKKPSCGRLKQAQPVQPAVAVNEVLLSASKLALDCLEVLTFGAECSPHYSVVIIKLKAAIRAAEAEKAKGGGDE